MTTEQEQFWMGDFGDEYTKRNRVNWLQRVPFWTDMIAKTGANTIIEVGCNAGWNLLAIRLLKDTNGINSYKLKGIDINENSIKQAKMFDLSAKKAEAITVGHVKSCCDLVFTTGCLIHIAPDYIVDIMQSIVRASRHYVLAVEYAADEEQEVEYRGHKERLWKRPYGKMYQDMGLTLIETGELSREDGFDNCAYWLLEK